MEIIRAGIVTARKPHECVWCAEGIGQGERHYSRTYNFEGQFISDRLHIECHEAMLKSDLWEEGFNQGEQRRGVSI